MEMGLSTSAAFNVSAGWHAVNYVIGFSIYDGHTTTAFPRRAPYLNNACVDDYSETNPIDLLFVQTCVVKTIVVNVRLHRISFEYQPKLISFSRVRGVSLKTFKNKIITNERTIQ